MADIPISYYKAVVRSQKFNPVNPPSLEDPPPVLNPPGSGPTADFVPYEGASRDVDLGSNDLTLDSVKFNDLTPNGILPRQLRWNNEDSTLDLGMGLGSVVQQMGQEIYHSPVKNQTGLTIPDGSLVAYSGSVGASGRINIQLAIGDGTIESRKILGIATHEILNGADGLVTWLGKVRGLNTTGTPVGETWVLGNTLWAHPTQAGKLTNVKPTGPNLKVSVGVVVNVHATQGTILVNTNLGSNLEELHNVSIITPATNDIIQRNSSGVWVNKSLSGAGIEPAITAGTTAQYWRGDKTFQTLNTLAVPELTNLYFTETRVRATPLTGYVVGTNTPITATHTLLTAVQDFQGQINARVSGGGTVNYLQKITSTGVIGDSQIFDNGTNVGIGTISPSASFTVNKNSGNPELALTVETGGGTTIFTMFGSVGTESLIGYRSGNSLRIGTVTGLGAAGFSEKFRITNAGNVGIGTNVPAFKLDFGDQAVANQIIIGTYISLNRWVGIGMSSTTAAIRIAGDNAQTTGVATDIGTYSNDTAHTWSSRLIITGDGNVGIGNINPSEKLHISGRLRLDTIDNAVGPFATWSATGVLQQRTAVEARGDIGAQIAIAGTATNGFVATVVAGVATWAAGAGGNFIAYDIAQSLTGAQKLQARINIGSTSATPQIIATAGAINDLAVTSNHLVFTGASVSLSGIVAGLDGEEFTILNASGTSLTILSEDILSVTANRFNTGLIIPNLSILRIKYRATSNRWFVENVGINDGRYVRKDVADTKTGNLTLLNNLSGSVGRLDWVTASVSGNYDGSIRFGENNIEAFRIGRDNVTGAGYSTPQFERPVYFYGSTDWRSGGLAGTNTAKLTVSTGRLFHARSGAENESIIRNEKYLNTSENIVTAGAINDQAITAGIFSQRFIAATSITGHANGENGRELTINNANTVACDLVYESASSVAANRYYFATLASLTIPTRGIATLIYNSTISRWELKNKNF